MIYLRLFTVGLVLIYHCQADSHTVESSDSLSPPAAAQGGGGQDFGGGFQAQGDSESNFGSDAAQGNQGSNNQDAGSNGGSVLEAFRTQLQDANRRIGDGPGLQEFQGGANQDNFQPQQQMRFN